MHLSAMPPVSAVQTPIASPAVDPKAEREVTPQSREGPQRPIHVHLSAVPPVLRYNLRLLSLHPTPNPRGKFQHRAGMERRGENLRTLRPFSTLWYFPWSDIRWKRQGTEEVI